MVDREGRASVLQYAHEATLGNILRHDVFERKGETEAGSDRVEVKYPAVEHEAHGGPLPVGHGASLRLGVERQLGYKQAKYVTAVEAVASLDGIDGGRGGHWENVGFYDWYAGI